MNLQFKVGVVMNKKLKNTLLLSFAILGLFTVAQAVINNEVTITYGYVNLEDDSNCNEQNLADFIQNHHTPFSKTIIKNDD